MVEFFQQSRADPPLSVRAEYTPFVNFAMQQNAVPLLRALAVTNFSDKQATHLVVRVWSDPPVVAEKTLRVDAIAPGANYAFSDLALTLFREPLRKQSEREEGHRWIEVAADGVTTCTEATAHFALALRPFLRSLVDPTKPLPADCPSLGKKR